MPIKLPAIIKNYVDASNEHHVKSILACFSDDMAWVSKRIKPSVPWLPCSGLL